MADLGALDRMIAELTADAVGDAAANDELRACLLAGVGMTIAARADGDTRLSSVLCDAAAVQVYESATLSMALFEDGRRL